MDLLVWSSSCVHAGCLSGRGQAESEAGGKVDKVLIQQMEEAYSSLPIRLPEVNPALHTLYQEWLQGQDSQQASTLLHTQYRNQSHTQPPHMQWWGERRCWTLKTWSELNGHCLWLIRHSCRHHEGWAKDHVVLRTSAAVLSFSHRGVMSAFEISGLAVPNLSLRTNQYPESRKTQTCVQTKAVMSVSCRNCELFMYIYGAISRWQNNWSSWSEPVDAECTFKESNTPHLNCPLWNLLFSFVFRLFLQCSLLINDVLVKQVNNYATVQSSYLSSQCKVKLKKGWKFFQ